MTRHFRSRDRGQTLVEFALILPVFLLVLLGILDLGRAVYYSSTLSNVSREAARLGITDQMCKDILDEATGRSVGLSTVTVTVKVLNPDKTLKATCPANPASTDFVTTAIGDLVDVKVQASYVAATPVISRVVGTIQMAVESVFAIESTCTVPSQASCPLDE